MQRACAILSSVAYPAVHYFPRYFIKGTLLGGGGGVTEHKMCVLIFSTAFVRNISHFKKK